MSTEEKRAVEKMSDYETLDRFRHLVERLHKTANFSDTERVLALGLAALLEDDLENEGTPIAPF